MPVDEPRSSSIFFRIGFICVFLFLFISLSRNISLILGANYKLHEAQDRVVSLEKESKQLSDELNVSGSMEFKEQEARDKLGMAKNDEIVVVLPPIEELRKLAPKRSDVEEKLPDPNWKKWMKLFI